jgi:hypothetical protein
MGRWSAHRSYLSVVTRRIGDDARVESAYARVAAKARVAYEEARELTRDPRAKQLALFVPLIAATGLFAMAMRTPATHDELKRALRLAGARRTLRRLVRKWATGVVPLREHRLEARAEIRACCGLYRALLAPGPVETVPLESLRTILDLGVKRGAFGQELLKGAEDVLHWITEIYSLGYGYRAIESVAGSVSAALRAVAVLLNKSDALGIDKEQTAALLAPFVKRSGIRELGENGQLGAAHGTALGAARLMVEYMDVGASRERIEKRLGPLDELIERIVVKVTPYVPRLIAARMIAANRFTEPTALAVEAAGAIFVDETEPYVEKRARLSEKLVPALAAVDGVVAMRDWAIEHTQQMCTQGFDTAGQMRYVVDAMKRKARECMLVAMDGATVDAAVYVALAARVIGFNAARQFTEHRAAVLGDVFALVACVARGVAAYAQKLVPDAIAESKSKWDGPMADRDLNLFHEPDEVTEHETIEDYAALCALLYDKKLLRFVAPGIEPDGIPGPIPMIIPDHAVAPECVALAQAGWGYKGVYDQWLPETKDEGPPREMAMGPDRG